MRVLCAWCGKELEESPGSGAGSGGEAGQPVSHGICPSCASWIESESAASSLETFLDGLQKPILIVDENGNVLFANARALAMLGKDLPQVRGFRGGDVFECANARLPGGCGNTVHCKGCAIRRTVEDTFDSGESAHGVPATLQTADGNGGAEIGFVISTEMVGEVVLLRIDEVDTGAVEEVQTS